MTVLNGTFVASYGSGLKLPKLYLTNLVAQGVPGTWLFVVGVICFSIMDRRNFHGTMFFVQNWKVALI